MEEIVDTLNNTAVACEDIIHNDIENQMDALKKQIVSLKNIINEKDKQLSTVLNQMNGVISNVDPFIEYMMSESDSQERSEVLAAINEEKSMEYKLDSLFKLIILDYMKMKSDNDIMDRLRSRLYNHVEFLNQLAQSTQLQEVVLGNDENGKCELSNQTRRFLIEQSEITTKMLNEFKTEINEDSMSKIEKVFLNKIDVSNRAVKIGKTIGRCNLKVDELGDLLVQEATITSLYNKYTNNLKNEIGKLKKFNLLREEQIKQNDIEFNEKAEDVFRKLCKAVGTEDEYSQEKFFELTRAIADDCLKARNKVGLKIGGFSAYVEKSDRALRKLSMRLEQAQTLLQKQSECNNLNVWSVWAKQLYVALIGFGASDSEENMRVTIENAALSAIGHAKHRHLIQKFNA